MPEDLTAFFWAFLPALPVGSDWRRLCISGWKITILINKARVRVLAMSESFIKITVKGLIELA